MGNSESKPAGGGASPDCVTRLKDCVNKGAKGSATTAKTPPTPERLAALKEKYAGLHQEHVFTYYDTLSPAEQAKLVAQLEEINPHEVLDRYARTTAKSKEEMSGGIEACVPTRSDLASPEDLAKWEKVGFEAISKGQIGVIVLAGGQGTRLGFHLPKGCFPGGDSELLSAWLPSGKTLFALQAERILRLQALAAEKTGATNPLIQWYVMTSPQTHADTEENLMNNNFYGLNPTQVHLFQQGTLPCIADDGNKFIMASPSEVATSPDGNGGIYGALHNSGMIEDMEQKGVKFLFTNAIDNCVCKIADPLFMGFSIDGGFKAGNKVTEKRDPDEKVGVQCKRNGVYDVVEYSDLAQELKEGRDETGKLRFSSGSVCIHYYSVDFLKNECHPSNLVKALDYHVAHKKIPAYDADAKEAVTPETENGVKLETFIFDVFKLAGDSFGVFEVQREEEFAPIKNKSFKSDGSIASDSPVASLLQMSHAQKQWLVRAGAKLVDEDGEDASENNELDVEISPLVSYGGEGLEELVSGKEIRLPCMIVEKGFFIQKGTRSDFDFRLMDSLGDSAMMYTAKPLQLGSQTAGSGN